ncbi:hypothetical protein [Methylophaga sp.]|uniref:hypothetical protein n=1 Tax=Methylophaga sp. TaxID=2024840 RepID=UPI003F6985F6
MNKFLLAGLCISMIGCTTASPKQFYRPAGATEQVEILGRFNQISFEHQVVVNGEAVITGDLPYNYDDATFTGTYGDTTVTSDCHWKSKTALQCLVKMNGEMAATLAF